MGKRKDYIQEILPRLGDHTAYAALEQYLLSNSNLPGPRGNLELAWAFADGCGMSAKSDGLWYALLRWASISSDEAGTGDAREFLPFCALQALAALYPAVDAQKKEGIVAILKAAASDKRWRLREAVAMGFQRMAESAFQTVEDIFSLWLVSASMCEQRAIIASLAHPPILKQAENALFALQLSAKIIENVVQCDSGQRKTEDFRILRQGLEYAISLFVVNAPQAGFANLRKWAAKDDADIRRIIKSNLGKARLAKKYVAEVNNLLQLLN